VVILGNFFFKTIEAVGTGMRRGEQVIGNERGFGELAGLVKDCGECVGRVLARRG
jgi:hypothetical protein